MTVGAGDPARLLVLGGTAFVGRHVVEAALAAGCRVSVLNRGQTDPGPWAALARVERLVGDRDGDLSALRGCHFDAVVDCSGYTAAHVTRVLDALGAGAPSASPPASPGAPPHYVFVSSISAYAAFPPGVDFDESAPLAEGEGYGADKARAEAALAPLPDACRAVVRPGLVAGPFDPTGRFTYWPLRAARGGDILAPGPPAREVHLIDARDLAAFLVALATGRRAGVFNAVGPWMTMESLLSACVRVAAGLGEAAGARLAWRRDDELVAAGVAPWTGLPLWIPADDAQFGGMMRASNGRAVAAGLACRPIECTIADTLAWARSPQARTPRQVATIDAAREAAVLAAPRDERQRAGDSGGTAR